MFGGGYWTLGRIAGIPVRLHWSIPLGAMLASRGTFAPGIWLGFFVLVLLHEAGHALLVRRRGLGVLAIDVHALGGVCRWTGSATALDVSIIAWGGVLAQLAVLVVALAVTQTIDVRGSFARQIVDVMISVNVSMIVLNLLPFRPFDGAEAWRIFGRLPARRAVPAPRRSEPRLRVVPPPPRRSETKQSHDTDEELPPMPGDIQKEMERIVREATLARRRNGGRNDPS